MIALGKKPIQAAEEIAGYLPNELRQIFIKIDETRLINAEELRIGIEKPMALFCKGKICFISATGNACQAEDAFIVSRDLLRRTVELLCENSVYAAQEQLKSGFVTLKGGHRAGVAGRVISEGNKISHISDISAVSIRFARQIIGAAQPLMDSIVVNQSPVNTLIISPPGCGKTTILRDIARNLGGSQYFFKTAVVDERCEIAACQKGVAYNDVGILTSVLECCPKPEGLMMLLRSMSPEVIITDEIGGREDCEALFSLINAGVKIICSVHGYDREDIVRRVGIRPLINEKIFQTVIVLSRRNGPGTIEKIYRE